MILVEHENKVKEEQNAGENEGHLEIGRFLPLVDLGAEDSTMGGRYAKIFRLSDLLGLSDLL